MFELNASQARYAIQHAPGRPNHYGIFILVDLCDGPTGIRFERISKAHALRLLKGIGPSSGVNVHVRDNGEVVFGG